MSNSNLLARYDLVCSADPAVTLLPLPETDEEKAKREKAGVPVPRQSRRPIRYLLAAPGPDKPEAEVESVAVGALRVKVRLLDCDEAYACGASPGTLTPQALVRAQHEATRICIQQVSGPGVDARTEKEIAEWRKSQKLKYLQPIGAWVIDESCGYNDPFDNAESG